MKKILISAGEESGDIYASQLAKELLKYKNIKVIGFGGDNLRRAGVDVKINLVNFAIVGFFEVFSKGINIIKVFNNALNIIKKEKIHTLIVVDYPGFHLKLIKKARKIGVKKIIYYITPQIWAWNYSRINIIKKYVDLAIVILPFEEKIFKKENINVKYLGHPLIEILKKYRNIKKDKNLIGLFPGSRNSEIKKILPIFLSVIKKFNKNYNFVLFKSESIDKSLIYDILKKHPDIKIKIISKKDYKKRAKLIAALAKSGTVVLELAILKVPQVVVYKGNYFSILIAKFLVKLKNISLVNILLNKKIIQEFIQNDAKENLIYEEMMRILTDNNYKKNILYNYERLFKMLNKEGKIVKNIAKEIIKEINK